MSWASSPSKAHQTTTANVLQVVCAILGMDTWPLIPLGEPSTMVIEFYLGSPVPNDAISVYPIVLNDH